MYEKYHDDYNSNVNVKNFRDSQIDFLKVLRFSLLVIVRLTPCIFHSRRKNF